MTKDGESWQFGPFEIRPGSGELWNSGRPVKLAPQPFEVLALVVRRAGAVVSREELRTAVWADGTMVEFDQGLNFCIRQIRIALNDDARNPTYIETIPKRGYRLVVPVSQTVDSAIGGTDAGKGSVWKIRAVGLGLVASLAIAAGWVMANQGTPSSVNSEVHRLFLEAEHLAGTWELDKVSAANERYQEAIRLDSEFAPAWAGLANTNVVLTFLGPRPAQALADSETHARRALELDESLAPAHAALGHSYWHQWKWHDAELQFHRALAIDDQTALVHQLYGLYLASRGRADDAIRHARRAVELAPVSGVINYSLAQVYLQTGQFDQAVTQAHRTLALDRHFPLAFQTLIRANSQLGRVHEAASALDAQRRFTPENTLAVWHAFTLARAGHVQQARAVIEHERARRSRVNSSLGEAAAYVAMGDMDAAFAALDEGITTHVPSVIWIQVAPELAPLRSDQRFAALLARMHLPVPAP